MDNTFELLNAVNVNGYTEKKNGLTYLTWSSAWAEVKKKCPEAVYEIVKQDNGLPYVYDDKTGYMVFTKVTIGEITHEMWLPVMDGANKAMKAEPYTYKTKYGEKSVEAATMFDINKTIMRCLVKNLAMFGLGLYIYAGEDLPEEEKAIAKPTARGKKVEELDYKKQVLSYIKRHKYTEEDIAKICNLYKVEKIEDLTAQHCQHYIGYLSARGGDISA